MERTITVMPRGGARKPGPGKRMGRPPGTGAGVKRLAVSISLQPEELDCLTSLCEKLGMDRSEFVRRSMANAWLFRLTDAQLDALRSLVEGGGHD
jgi:hypothetical protein